MNSVFQNQKNETVMASHFQFSIFNGEESISGIAWQMGENLPPTSYPLDLALRFRWNHWNGRRLPQMVLRDWRKAEE